MGQKNFQIKFFRKSLNLFLNGDKQNWNSISNFKYLFAECDILGSIWMNIWIRHEKISLSFFFVIQNIFSESSFTEKTRPKWGRACFQADFAPGVKSDSCHEFLNLIPVSQSFLLWCLSLKIFHLTHVVLKIDYIKRFWRVLF